MQVHLKKSVEVSINGKMEESQFLNIEEPNRGNIIDVAELKEIGSAALLSAKSMFSSSEVQEAQSKTQEEPTDTGFDSDTALMMLKMGGKYKESIIAFDKFLLKYGKFDDTKVQTGSLDRMDLKDYETALGQYFGAHCFL